jgi:L-lysine exporter family protein LysE/ArgO
MLAAAVQGYLVGLSLIVAIGSQNAFVLRQGLRREHVGAVVAICALSDAVLIAAGVLGMGRLVVSLPWLVEALRWMGVAFLTVYGALRFRSALAGGSALVAEQGAAQGLGAVILACLMFTWANPHVYLDTLVLVGAVAAQYAPQERAFGIGAATASLSFFAALGYGARLLRPVFARPGAWVVLELLIGVIMWAIAARLAFGG